MAQETGALTGVVGAGRMGIGVAQCLAQAGYQVVVVDPEPAARQRAPQQLRDSLRLTRLLRPATASDRFDEIAERVEWQAELAALAEASFVVECARERPTLKEQIFTELDRVCAPDAVFASCTSAIPIARLAACCRYPERVLGMHFMNPAPLKDAVEVIRAPKTSDDTLQRAERLLTRMGKRALVVRDAPGFVSNRVLMLTVNEAATVVHEGTADADTVDEIFQSCFEHQMGPLRTADLIGLDTVLDSLYVLLEHTGDDRFQPCPLLVELVEAGHVGRKTGRGFHTYPSTLASSPVPTSIAKG